MTSPRFPVQVDKTSSVAPYEQLRVGIIEAVRSGELAAGTQLPTVRALASDIGLAVNTVAKTYRELESGGVIETRGRHGSFVSTSGDSTRDAAARAAAEYLSTARRLGYSVSEALEIVQRAAR